jgi:hypothetical protein
MRAKSGAVQVFSVYAENHCLSGCLDEINLELVEREVTPGSLMSLSFQFNSPIYHIRLPYLFSTYLMFNNSDLPFTTGHTSPIYN